MMTRQVNLIEWIGYWDRATGPNLHEVHTLSDMRLCRMFNPVMQKGVMYDVSDEQLWAALQTSMRKFTVYDYTDPGAGVRLGTVLGHTWDEAFRRAEAVWPGRVLHVSIYG